MFSCSRVTFTFGRFWNLVMAKERWSFFLPKVNKFNSMFGCFCFHDDDNERNKLSYFSSSCYRFSRCKKFMRSIDLQLTVSLKQSNNLYRCFVVLTLFKKNTIRVDVLCIQWFIQRIVNHLTFSNKKLGITGNYYSIITQPFPLF